MKFIILLVVLVVLLFFIQHTMIKNKNSSINYENLEAAVCAGELSAVKKKVESTGGDLKLDSSDKPLILYSVEMACRKNIEIIRYLINKGIDVNEVSGNHFNGSSALMLAVSSSSEEIIKLLIDSGADVNLGSSDGLTPLLVLAANFLPVTRDYSVAKILMKAGADAHVSDAIGYTAIDYAKNTGDKKLINILNGIEGTSNRP